MRNSILSAALVALGALAWPASAGVQEPPEPQDETAEKDEDDLPSLDDLLGITGDAADRSAADAAEREARDELQRELNEQEISDAFEVALEKMQLTADLLERKLDAGLGTQRLQKEILAKLDELIDAARNQQMSSSSSSGSGSQGRQQQQGQSMPGRQRQSGPRTNQQAQDSSPGADPPPRQEGDINTVIEETRAEWGHLPERLRRALHESLNDPPSSLYRRLTEEYYRRLAEEGSP